MPVREISTPGSCTVWRGDANDAILNRPPVLAPHINLDAGTLTVQGAVGVQRDELSRKLLFRTVGYGRVCGTAVRSGTNQRISGAWNVHCILAGRRPGPGGKLIGAFNAQIAVPAPPKFDNRFAVGDVQRGQGVTVNWSGVDAGALVEIRGVSAPSDPALGAVTFFCVEKASAGQFTIPPNVLLSLPPSGSSTAANGSALGLSVGVTGVARFTAPGVDCGLLRYSSVFGRSVTFQYGHRPKQRIFGPAATATYCLPPNVNVIGEAFMRTLVGNCQSVLPFR